MGSFFRNQTFPKNWHRRPTAAGFNEVGNVVNDIIAPHQDVVPGANNAQGVYIVDNVTEVSRVEPFLPYFFHVLRFYVSSIQF